MKDKDFWIGVGIALLILLVLAVIIAVVVAVGHFFGPEAAGKAIVITVLTVGVYFFAKDYARDKPSGGASLTARGNIMHDIEDILDVLCNLTEEQLQCLADHALFELQDRQIREED